MPDHAEARPDYRVTYNLADLTPADLTPAHLPGLFRGCADEHVSNARFAEEVMEHFDELADCYAASAEVWSDPALAGSTVLSENWRTLAVRATELAELAERYAETLTTQADNLRDLANKAEEYVAARK